MGYKTGKKSKLTIDSAFDIRMLIVPVYLSFPHIRLSLKPRHNSKSSLNPPPKSEKDNTYINLYILSSSIKCTNWKKKRVGREAEV